MGYLESLDREYLEALQQEYESAGYRVRYEDGQYQASIYRSELGKSRKGDVMWIVEFCFEGGQYQGLTKSEYFQFIPGFSMHKIKQFVRDLKLGREVNDLEEFDRDEFHQSLIDRVYTINLETTPGTDGRKYQNVSIVSFDGFVGQGQTGETADDELPFD